MLRQPAWSWERYSPKGVTFPHLTARDRVQINGKTGSGKGNAAKKLIHEAMKRGTRVVAFDRHDEYSVRGRQTDQVRLGPLTHRCSVAELIADYSKWLDVDDLALAVVPEKRGRDLCAEDFVEVAGFVRETGNLLFVVDEIGYFGDRHEANEELVELATQDRHENVSCVFVAQCAVQIEKTARRNMSQLITGRQDDHLDLRAIAELTKNPAFAQRVGELEAGELMQWRDTDKPPSRSGVNAHAQ